MLGDAILALLAVSLMLNLVLAISVAVLFVRAKGSKQTETPTRQKVESNATIYKFKGSHVYHLAGCRHVKKSDNFELLRPCHHCSGL